jgi:hypothetical protein
VNETTVVNCRDAEYDVYIGRGSIWGNPYVIGKLSRSEVIERYREWILGKPELLSRLEELRGKRLGCWCVPKPCHGSVLVELLKENK